MDPAVRDGHQSLHPLQEVMVLEDYTLGGDPEETCSATLQVEDGLDLLPGKE
jgi:hypothetical protein